MSIAEVDRLDKSRIEHLVQVLARSGDGGTCGHVDVREDEISKFGDVERVLPNRFSTSQQLVQLEG